MKKILSIFIVVIVLVSVLTISVSAYGFDSFTLKFTPSYEQCLAKLSNTAFDNAFADCKSRTYYNFFVSPWSDSANYVGVMGVLIGSNDYIRYVDNCFFVNRNANSVIYYFAFGGQSADWWSSTNVYSGSPRSHSLTDSFWYSTVVNNNLVPFTTLNGSNISIQSGSNFKSNFFQPVGLSLLHVPSFHSAFGMNAVLSSTYYLDGYFEGTPLSLFESLDTAEPSFPAPPLDVNYYGSGNVSDSDTGITVDDNTNSFSYETVDGKGIFIDVDSFGGMLRAVLTLFKYPPLPDDDIKVNIGVTTFTLISRDWFISGAFSKVRSLMQAGIIVGLVFFVIRQIKRVFSIEEGDVLE